MAETWAISGLDLHLDLAGPRVRAALEARAARGGPSGRLRAGHAAAVLAGARGRPRIARNTVAEAYGQLVAEGWLTAVQGSGTRVAERGAPARPAAAAADRRGGRARRATTCGPGRPTCRRFPRPAWLAAARRALTPRAVRRARLRRPARAGPSCAPRWPTTWPGRAASAPPPTGSWSAPGSPRRSALLCQVLRRARRRHARGRGTTGSGGTGRSPRAAGCALRRCRWTATARVVEAARSGRRGRCSPRRTSSRSGSPLAPRRRRRGHRLGPARGGLVIEDDYDGEFRYDRQPARRDAGARARARRVRRHREQDARARAAAGLAGRPARRCSTTLVAAKALADRQQRRDRPAHPGRAASPRAATTATSAARGSSTAGAATGWSRRWPAARPGPGAGIAAGLHALRRAAARRERGRRGRRAPPRAGWPSRGCANFRHGAGSQPAGARGRLRQAARARVHGRGGAAGCCSIWPMIALT